MEMSLRRNNRQSRYGKTAQILPYSKKKKKTYKIPSYKQFKSWFYPNTIFFVSNIFIPRARKIIYNSVMYTGCSRTEVTSAIFLKSATDLIHHKLKRIIQTISRYIPTTNITN